jgi:hypothetical protein
MLLVAYLLLLVLLQQQRQPLELVRMLLENLRLMMMMKNLLMTLHTVEDAYCSVTHDECRVDRQPLR